MTNFLHILKTWPFRAIEIRSRRIAWRKGESRLFVYADVIRFFKEVQEYHYMPPERLK